MPIYLDSAPKPTNQRGISEMRTLTIFALLTLSLNVDAEQAFGRINFSQPTLKYDYVVARDPGDPSWTTAKVSHVGNRAGVSPTQHQVHIEFQQLPSSAPINHISPPSYPLHPGTHQYCSEITPASELTGPGVQTQVIFHNYCIVYCLENPSDE